MNKISIKKMFSEIKNYGDTINIGNINDCFINLIKVHGSYSWHSHESRDKMILVTKGVFKIGLQDQEIILKEGDVLIIPRGVIHSAEAESEAWVLLIE